MSVTRTGTATANSKKWSTGSDGFRGHQGVGTGGAGIPVPALAPLGAWLCLAAAFKLLALKFTPGSPAMRTVTTGATGPSAGAG